MVPRVREPQHRLKGMPFGAQMRMERAVFSVTIGVPLPQRLPQLSEICSSWASGTRLPSSWLSGGLLARRRAKPRRSERPQRSNARNSRGAPSAPLDRCARNTPVEGRARGVDFARRRSGCFRSARNRAKLSGVQRYGGGACRRSPRSLGPHRFPGVLLHANRLTRFAGHSLLPRGGRIAARARKLERTGRTRPSLRRARRAGAAHLATALTGASRPAAMASAVTANVATDPQTPQRRPPTVPGPLGLPSPPARPYHIDTSVGPAALRFRFTVGV